MYHVQNCDSYINVPSSQTYRSHYNAENRLEMSEGTLTTGMMSAFFFPVLSIINQRLSFYLLILVLFILLASPLPLSSSSLCVSYYSSHSSDNTPGLLRAPYLISVSSYRTSFVSRQLFGP
jgi:hypothetical protein